ncbi:eukaryotic translation initiation factor 4E class II [Russula earlei]|uniref:Eukaryotic translation initiation factor 4E class II n=1 Tax=Russula earlei TaxID=71964 RepID=A0ACC0TR06_9AGAM|nr:eukaryotic translation initiation factor 4E class II [Russula earlei]
MANYFSNLSSTSTQSRFLSNKDKDSSQLSSTTVVATTIGSSPSPSRVPSKHFSTTLSDDQKGSSMREKSPTASSAGLPTLSVHPLRSTWVFWFRQQRAPGNKITNYEEGIKKISSFASVESFWSLWTHLHPPSALLPTTDYLLFHQGVRRPVWEDPLNLPGGKWILRLRKGVADRIWEDLVLALIGDQFAGVAPTHEDEWPEICGCTISVRQNEDILSVWNRIDEPKLRERIRDRIRAVLHLPQSTIMEYKSNNDSMADKSSFRNSIIDRTPLS